MEIKDFCKDFTTEQLLELKKGVSDINQIAIKNFVTPDNINTMVQALNDGTVLDLGKDILTLSISYMCNAFNAEVIEKELFRREMEEV